MATHRITAPDGAVYEVTAPADARDADILAYVQAQHPDVPAKPAAAPKPADPVDNSRLRGLALGVSEPLENIGRFAQSLLPANLKAASDAQDRALGSKTPDEIIAGQSAARANNTRTGYQMLGNIAGTAPAAVVKGGLAVQGAISGAALSKSDSLGGVALDAGIGAGSSVVGGAAMRGLGNVISPKVSPIVKRLLDQGVKLTPGQILGAGEGYVGRIAKSVEDKLTGFPIVGDAISAARERGNQSFNAAAINRALRPIGEKLDRGLQSGRDAISQAADKLSAAYNDLVPHLGAQIDDTFATANSTALDRVAKLAPNKADQFRSIVDDALGSRAKGDMLHGEELKVAESKLSAEADRFSKSQDPDQQIVGQGLKSVLTNFRAAIGRSNPEHGARLAKINEGYANLVRVEKAAAGAKDGVFSPAQLATAVRQGGTRKTNARGAALMGDLADDARGVLPSGTGDSGTAGRGAVGLVAGGVLGLPAVAGAAGLALPYTRVGQRVATAALTGRQGAVPQYLARLTAGAARPVSIAAPALLRRPNE